jgi:hypothetical protein
MRGPANSQQSSDEENGGHQNCWIKFHFASNRAIFRGFSLGTDKLFCVRFCHNLHQLL